MSKVTNAKFDVKHLASFSSKRSTKILYPTGEIQTRNTTQSILGGKYERISEALASNKGRFCNTIASVALVHTSIQSD